jgi:purine-nucleoside phosphorylase
MVYQEFRIPIHKLGVIVPKDIATAPAAYFSNLLRYYRMDTKDDIIDDLTTTAIDIVGAKIYNNKSIYMQQALCLF